MIEKLYIKNYLIVKEAEIDFSEGLNILTGETGAGKSIILDALALILGERADYSLIKKEEEKLVVEGYLNLNKNESIGNIVKNILTEDYESNLPLILRREIHRKGVSRNFVNDTPVNISDMKKLGDAIVDIHSQNEHQSLLNKETHQEILDSYIDKKKLFSEYEKNFTDLSDLIKQHKELFDKKDELAAKKNFLDYELKEINNVNMSEGEDTQLENELKILENAEDISNAFNLSIKELYEDDSNALASISNAIKELKKASEFDERIRKIIEDLESSLILVKESSESLNSFRNSLNFDNTKADEMRERLSRINHLKKKYSMTVSELISKAQKLEKELIFAENFDYELEELQKKIKLKKKQTSDIAAEISQTRKKKSSEFEKKINLIFKETGLESAEFKVDLKNITCNDDDLFGFKKGGESFMKLGKSGFDDIEFLIKTNKGSDFAPLRKSASGGEISRIMLAIKTVLSQKSNVPILVFDEIDAGISGRIAQRVGKLLKSLSKSYQIICITHLPQIAALSDRHFHVSKQENANHTTASIKILNYDEKTKEIAKLISGEKVTEAATKSAIELING